MQLFNSNVIRAISMIWNRFSSDFPQLHRLQGLFFTLTAFLLAALSSPCAAQTQPAAAEQPTSFIYCYQGRVDDPAIIVVDKSLQRAMVFKYLGDMALQWEFPCGTGEKEGDKAQAGDQKTPEGVYFITHRYEDRKVTVFGDRALHLDYPNAIDCVDGRQGDGIYLHGTNRDLRPRSSNGCITLDNRDLARLSQMIRDQSTPVLVLDRFQLPKPADLERACQFLQRLRFSNFALEQESASHALAVKQGGCPVFDGVQDLPNRLTALDGKGHAGGVVQKVTGAALWGAGDQWIVLANLEIAGRDGKTLPVSRRLYFQGHALDSLSLVRSQWVLEDPASVKLLASWLPPSGAKTASNEPVRATVEAKAKPVRAAERPRPTPAKVEKPAKAEKEIKALLNAWLGAWEGKKLKRYMSYYAADFYSDGMNKVEWRNKKAYLNKVYKVLRVSAKDVKINVNGSTAKVKFVQYYQSDWHKDVGVKTMTLVQRKGDWRIKSEQWRAITPARRSQQRR